MNECCEKVALMKKFLKAVINNDNKDWVIEWAMSMVKRAVSGCSHTVKGQELDG